ncbi:MAG: LexA family transcriptional regulator [Tatlockia sp.]|nr:LexA family transcriptional regulator [Tatlockia sp.]
MVTIYKNRLDVLNAREATFGDRIEFLIDERGISKLWLAEKLGITKQALNYLIKHSSKPKYIDALAEIMQANPSWIEFGKGLPFENQNLQVNSSDKVKLKIYDLESLVSYFNDKEEQSDQNQFIDYQHPNLENFFAFRIQNDSVFPPFMENTVLIFEKEKKPLNGDYVLIITKQDSSVLVRQFSKDGNDSYYSAKNNDYKSFVNIDATIKGVLVEARYLL